MAPHLQAVDIVPHVIGVMDGPGCEPEYLALQFAENFEVLAGHQSSTTATAVPPLKAAARSPRRSRCGALGGSFQARSGGSEPPLLAGRLEGDITIAPDQRELDNHKQWLKSIDLRHQDMDHGQGHDARQPHDSPPRRGQP